MTAPIVVATDLTARSDRPFDRAAMLAAHGGRRLVIVHVVEDGEGAQHRMKLARRAIDREVEALGVPFDLVLGKGAAPQAIADTVESCGAALVVVGAARYNHVSDFFLGTAVDYLVRRSVAPVLVVKERAREPYDGVIVGTDFSGRSAHALVAAAALFDLPITLVNAFGSPFPKRLGADASLEFGETWSKEEMDRFLALPELAPWLDRISPQSMASSPPEAIAHFAALHRSPLTVVGSHGWGTIAQALLGSRVSEMLTAIAQDVLVVRDGVSV